MQKMNGKKNDDVNSLVDTTNYKKETKCIKCNHVNHDGFFCTIWVCLCLQLLPKEQKDEPQIKYDKVGWIKI